MGLSTSTKELPDRCKILSKVAIGGTFEPLHDGHKALLERVFELAHDDEVLIGLTSDAMARSRYRTVLSYGVREENLRRHIKREFDRNDMRIVELNDPYGPTLEEDFDYLVVSPETKPTALEINKIRAKDRRQPIEISVVEYVLAEDEDTISSTRIKNGIIDKHGNLI